LLDVRDDHHRALDARHYELLVVSTSFLVRDRVDRNLDALHVLDVSYVHRECYALQNVMLDESNDHRALDVLGDRSAPTT
jgi:hypothetical protein